ncbi:MAG: Tat pathway signal protein [Cyclobacteriaceae bacterium]|nr:Tat pathway signal protein [Cyclobacteriaceae bacterium]
MRLAIALALLMLTACSKPTQVKQTTAEVSASDPFLDSLSHDTFMFFWEQADKQGQVPDRWPTPSFSSIAATGFGLTTYLVGVERGYITREQAAERVLTTLSFFANGPKGEQKENVIGYKGFFYHFLDAGTGTRFKTVELSTIDTGLLLGGVLSCQTYFDQDNETERRIRELADALYRDVDWNWAMNGQSTMSMGWHPEHGFIDAYWRGYNEAMLIYILGLASPTHPIPADSWKAWTASYQWAKYQGQEFINFGPLFGHQYSHLWIDFKGIQDTYTASKGIDYFENSRRATLANRAYCINNPAGYADYSENIWGLTACDGPANDNKANPNINHEGYWARGASQYYLKDDGTIAPTAAGASIPFAPEVCVPALKEMKRKYGKSLYQQYGFVDAFNPSFERTDGTKGWFDKDYLGLDQGPIVIQIENYKSGFVWNLMRKNPYIRDGLRKAGFTGGWLAE